MTDEIQVTIFEGAGLQKLKDDLATKAFGAAPTQAGCCRRCRERFTTKNVFTVSGWKETDISGVCEKCWDELWKEEA